MVGEDYPAQTTGSGLPERGRRFRCPGAALYDALLDDYEPGARSAELAVLFQALREELVPLVQTISEASARRTRDEEGSQGGAGAHGAAILRRAYPLDRQRVFGETVAAALGFDFQRGRLDVTAHPFCTGIGPGDTRITTRYDERQFSDAFFGVLHEVGHALYEQGLPAEHFGTPMGESVSLGVHESQSRLWENAVGRSRPFWMYWFPMARRVFHQALHDVTLDQFLAAVNHVEPSLIRVQADEVTYNLHIIIRFELEQALLADELPISALPDTWNQKYREALGVTPANDAEGCLQDIHWSAGLLGYFPTYTLGNVYAAQLFARARADLAGLDGSFARGDSGELLAWPARQRPSSRPALPIRTLDRARHPCEAQPWPSGHRALAEIWRALRALRPRSLVGRSGDLRTFESESEDPRADPRGEPLRVAAGCDGSCSGFTRRDLMSHDLNPSTAMAPAPSPVPNPAPTRRLGSIDAYRGLVMFLMMAEVLRFARWPARCPGTRSGNSSAITSRTWNGSAACSTT